MAWTIIRPTAYMETWARLIGAPLLATGRTRIFGRGANPINFVSAGDVARLIARAAGDPALCGRVVEMGGSENLTMRQFAQAFITASGATGDLRHIPRPVMRVMAVLLRSLNPALARQIQAGVVMDTAPMSLDVSGPEGAAPARLAEVVRRHYGGGSGAERARP